MEYPLIINGVRRGAVRVTQEGLYTVFEAEAEGTEETPVRLALYGGGEEGYLGVMQPWSGGMFLCRRMSRTERAKMPHEIEYAAPAGETHGAPTALERTEREPERTEIEKSEQAKVIPAPEAERRDTANEDADGEGLLWFSRPDGTLTAFDGERSIIALPTHAPGGKGRAVIREINGKRYMLFRY